MTPRLAPLTLLAILLPAAPATAQRAPDPAYLRAFGMLYGTAQLGGLIKQWCDARAPETRAATDSALAGWKAAYQLDDIEARADEVLGAQRVTVEREVAARRETIFRALDRESRAPASDCRQMRGYLDRSANPQRINRAEFALVARERERARGAAQGSATSTGTATTASAQVAPPPAGTAARGTLYTVAQLAVLTKRDPRTAEARLKQMGFITVQGTLEAYRDRPDETVWLNTVRDGWRSTDHVLCHDLSFRQLYNAGRRDVIIRGRVREVRLWIVLEDCQVVTNPAGLIASTMSDSAGLERLAVPVERLRTAPNAGLTMAQIEGVYQPADLRFNPNSLLYEPDDRTYLVLRDGWLHDDLRVTPHDLDVATSRRLEPQHWHRWRRTGTTLEMQEHDEYGRTDGAWKRLKLVRRAPIGTRRLNGTFQDVSSATAGMPGSGGAFAMSTRTFTFRPDGRFSWTAFNQMYSSSSVGTGQGGASVVAGGAIAGPSGTTASSVGSSEDQGTWSIDGYTLQLRTNAGTLTRWPIFSWDSARYADHLVINGSTYSPPKP